MNRLLCCACLAATVIAQGAHAASPSVTAVLTSSETVLGRPVQLEIKVSDARGVTPPRSIAADGLDIRYTGESQNIVMRNFQMSSSVTFNYTVMPMKSGTFRIPAQMLQAGGATLRTPELTLHVSNASAFGSNRAPQNSGQADLGKVAFAELIVPKTSAYVGEIIPVVVRIGFNSRARTEGMEPPQLTGQGFTMQKLSDPERSLETISGRAYVVFSYKTAVSAARAGNLQLGPIETKANVLVPRQSATRHTPFDPFDGDDPFSDPFFSDPFGRFLERRELTIKSEPANLEVKPLPPGAPASFSGAIGNFSLKAQANPKRVQIGDPITIKAEISGRGNFDRIDAPALSDESGWHRYPPAATFKQDDDVGISGTKTFEMVISPNEKKSAVPPLAFSYFDPVQEKYISLQSNAEPIVVEGGAAPSPAAAVGAASPAGSPTAGTVSTKPEDILPQIKERGAVVQTFAPLFARPGFWWAQLAPLVIALGLGGWKYRSRRAVDREARRNSALRREADELLRRLRRDELPPEQYLADASRVVQLKTALKQNVEPATVDSESAASVFGLDEARREELRRLFATADELRYSGASNGSVSTEKRREALELIEGLS
ncbi:MAG: protein BatD [Verrucomicrobia bacterium]|nr:protein BatD [Verrucomicrobiota bacterium]